VILEDLPMPIPSYETREVKMAVATSAQEAGSDVVKHIEFHSSPSGRRVGLTVHVVVGKHVVSTR